MLINSSSTPKPYPIKVNAITCNLNEYGFNFKTISKTKNKKIHKRREKKKSQRDAFEPQIHVLTPFFTWFFFVLFLFLFCSHNLHPIQTGFVQCYYVFDKNWFETDKERKQHTHIIRFRGIKKEKRHTQEKKRKKKPQTIRQHLKTAVHWPSFFFLVPYIQTTSIMRTFIHTSTPTMLFQDRKITCTCLCECRNHWFIIFI